MPLSGMEAPAAPLEAEILVASQQPDAAPHREAPAMAEVTGPRFVEPAPPFAAAVESPVEPLATGSEGTSSMAAPPAAGEPDLPELPAPHRETTSQANPLRGRNDMDVAPSGVPGIFGVFEPGMGPVTIATMAAAAPDVAMPEEPDRAVAAPVAPLPPMLPAVEPPRPALTDISQLPKLAYIPMPLPTGRRTDALTRLRDLGMVADDLPTELHAQPAAAPQIAPLSWHEPRALLAELEELSSHNAVKPWARETQRVVHDMTAAAARGPATAKPLWNAPSNWPSTPRHWPIALTIPRRHGSCVRRAMP